MAGLWPWLAVAGLGALHGLNPATGWMLAAAWGVHSRNRKQALRALAPIAVGHALSVGLLLVVAICHLTGAGLALWSFMMSTAHGAGLMLVPALMPLCISDAPARDLTASGSLALALVAVSVHTAAMLAVTGLIATGVCGSVDAAVRLLRSVRSLPARR
jgi:hypothetical protein